jgi:amino acid transporter
MTGLLLLIGGYLESTIQAEFKVDPLPAWAWTLLVIALIGAVLYFGVRISVRSQLVLALISIVVVTIFFIVVIVKLGSANSLKPFNPSSAADGWSGIFFGVLYGILMFVGFETAANLAEETPKPHKHIPSAVMFTEMADEEMAAFGASRGVGVPEAYSLVTSLVPQRRPARAPEVAAVVCWLLSDAASYVNGAVIPVDGAGIAVDAGTLPFDPRVEVRRGPAP